MMKKKPHLLFSAASPSSLSTIGAISDIRSLSYIFPSSLSNNQSRPPLSSVSSLYVFTIRAISEIRSFLRTFPSPLPNNQSRPVPSAAPSPSPSAIRDIREIRSFSYIVPSSLSNNQSRPPPRLHRLPLCPPFVTFEKFVVFQIKSPPPCQIFSPLPPLACTVSLSVHHS